MTCHCTTIWLRIGTIGLWTVVGRDRSAESTLIIKSVDLLGSYVNHKSCATGMKQDPGLVDLNPAMNYCTNVLLNLSWSFKARLVSVIGSAASWRENELDFCSGAITRLNFNPFSFPAFKWPVGTIYPGHPRFFKEGWTLKQLVVNISIYARSESGLSKLPSRHRPILS